MGKCNLNNQNTSLFTTDTRFILSFMYKRSKSTHIRDSNIKNCVLMHIMPTGNRGHFLVDPSHAPLLASISLFCARERLIMLLKGVGTVYMLLPLMLCMTFLSYEINNIYEARIVGKSTRERYMISFYWLVAAEAFAFFSLLFSWFTKSIRVPAARFNRVIVGAEISSALRLRLINSALLLSSSVTVAYSRIGLGYRSISITVSRLCYTILLRVIFLRVQRVEFSISSLTMSRRFYRSILFSSLRFHRIHVLVRVLFLLYALRRVLSRNSTPENHPVYLCSVIY